MDADPNRNRGLAPAEVVTLAEVVDYSEGAIVSRVMLKSKAGTVTLFAFDAGQELSEHTAPFDALVEVIDGRGEFTIAGEAHRLGAGEAVLMPADVPHAVHAVERMRFLLTMLRD